jgi:hypothetical protein
MKLCAVIADIRKEFHEEFKYLAMIVGAINVQI